MDATPASSGHGFDAALKALEDLDTPVPTQEAQPPAAAGIVIEPIAIDFEEGETAGEPAAILAVPVAEAAPAVAAEPVGAPIAIAPETIVDAAPVSAAPEPAPAPVAAALSVPPLAIPAEAPPAPIAAAPSKAAAAPVEAVAPVAASAPSRLTKVAIGLGLFSSVLSAAGLIVAERTIVSAQLVVADARERAHQFEQANKVIHDLGIIRDKQIELLAAQQVQLSKMPVSSEEFQHRMETLQAGIIARDPITTVVGALREGQSDTNSRIADLGLKLDRMNGEH